MNRFVSVINNFNNQQLSLIIMNPYMIKHFEASIEPVMCKMWQMGEIFPDYPISHIKTNVNQQVMSFYKNYDLTTTFGNKYVKDPTLYFIQHDYLTKPYHLSDFIDMMNFDSDKHYIGDDGYYVYSSCENYSLGTIVDMMNVNSIKRCMDENGEFIFSECEKYTTLQNRIYTAVSNRKYPDNMSFTKLYYVNVKTTRNVLVCLDNVDCIINYCNDGIKKWYYNPDTQLCYYSLDGIVAESDKSMLFKK